MKQPLMKPKLKRPGIRSKEGLKVSGIYGAIFTLLGSSFFPDIPDDAKHQIMLFMMEAVKGFSKASPGEIVDWIMRVVAAAMIFYSQLMVKDDKDEQPTKGDGKFTL